MVKTMLEKCLGLSAVAVVIASLSFGGGLSAAEKAKKKTDTAPATTTTTTTPPATTPAAAAPRCNSLAVEGDCKARTDCSWIAASIDAKTQKQKRKAYCRRKGGFAKKAKKT